MTITTALILAPLGAMASTVVLTAVVRTIAVRAGRVPETRADRWHTRPTPNVGGIGIVAGVVVALGMAVLMGQPDLGALERAPQGILPWNHATGLFVGALMMFALGLTDDFLHLRPVTKLVGQVMAAGVLTASGIGVWFTGVYAVDALLSLFWFVAITNAMNLLDNMDGVAGGVGAIAAGFLGITFLQAAEPGLALIAFVLAGSLVGFLVHNYPPARIFMGDSGSLFLGITLAGLALSPTPGLSRGLFAIMAVPVVILAIPILDTAYVAALRLIEGRAISKGGRDHTSHGLVALGVSEERAMWVLWTLALLGGGVGLMVRTSSRTFAYFLGGVLLLVLGLIGAFLLTSRLEASEAASSKDGTPGAFYRLRELTQRVPVFAFMLDLVLVGLSYFAAYIIRWDPAQLDAELVYFQQTLVLVVALKLAAFAVSGVYAPRFRHYGSGDVVHLLKANLIGTLLTASVLLLVHRVGLSRGVVMVDFLVCTMLTTGGRFSFLLMEGALKRWSKKGTAAILLGPLNDAELAFSALERITEPDLRPVCVVDRWYLGRKGAFKGYPLFGGVDGLERAVRDTGAHAVVVLEHPDGTGSQDEALSAYLDGKGSLDVYRLELSLRAEAVRVGVVSHSD